MVAGYAAIQNSHTGYVYVSAINIAVNKITQ